MLDIKSSLSNVRTDIQTVTLKTGHCLKWKLATKVSSLHEYVTPATLVSAHTLSATFKMFDVHVQTLFMHRAAHGNNNV